MNTNDDSTTNTDNKLKSMLEHYLDAEKYNEILNIDHAHWYPRLTLLISISTVQSSEDVLILVQKFLEDLPKDEAVEYVNKKDQYGECALLECEDVEMMKIILKYVTNINTSDHGGHNALMMTFRRISAPINLEMIKVLIDGGIDVNSSSVSGGTALMLCCTTYHCRYDSNYGNNADNYFDSSADEGNAYEGNADESNIDESNLDEGSADEGSADESSVDEDSADENSKSYLERDVATIENNDKIIRLLILSGADVLIKEQNKLAYNYIVNKKLLSKQISDLLKGITSMSLTKRALRSAGDVDQH